MKYWKSFTQTIGLIIFILAIMTAMTGLVIGMMKLVEISNWWWFLPGTAIFSIIWRIVHEDTR